LQSKGKSQPKVDLMTGSDHLMPRAAITTTSDQATAEYLAREATLRDIAEEIGDKVVPIKGKAKPAKAKPPKKY
jgi:hypothetical protein